MRESVIHNKKAIQDRTQIKDWGLEQAKWPWGLSESVCARVCVCVCVKAWMMVKREEKRGVIVSSIFEDLNWQLQQTLKAHYGRRMATQKHVESARLIRPSSLNRRLSKYYMQSHTAEYLHTPRGKQNSSGNQMTSWIIKKKTADPTVCEKSDFWTAIAATHPQGICLA